MTLSAKEKQQSGECVMIDYDQRSYGGMSLIFQV